MSGGHNKITSAHPVQRRSHSSADTCDSSVVTFDFAVESSPPSSLITAASRFSGHSVLIQLERKRSSDQLNILRDKQSSYDKH